MMVYRHEDRPKKASVTVTVDGQFDDPVEAPTPRGVDVPKPQHDVPPGLAPEKDPPHASSVVPQIQQQQVPPAMMMQSMSGFGFPMMAPPGMQPVMIRPAQYVLVPQPMFFPGATAQYQPYQQSQTTPHVAATCTNSTSPETQWHIPMSHNYHPAVGIVPDKQQKSDAAHNLLRLASLHRTKEDIKTPPNPIAESNPMFEDGEPFPIIKEDADYKFPIEESEVNEVDVLCGRGGATNAHPGNVHFRSLVDYYRLQYGTVKKIYKSNIAKTIVKAVRTRHGRFLKKSDTSEAYYEIGDVKAKDKTSQTLREGMAELVRRTLTAKAGDKPEEDAEPTSKRQKTGEATEGLDLD